MAFVKICGEPYLIQRLLAEVSFKHLVYPTCSNQEPTRLAGQQPLLPFKSYLEKPTTVDVITFELFELTQSINL